MNLRSSLNLFLTPALAVSLASLVGMGCAGIKPGASTGAGGSGSYVPPPIDGLTSIAVSPPSSNVTLTMATDGTLSAPSVSLTATGTINGSSSDVTAKVSWSSNLPGAVVSGGTVTVSAPGSYTITASSGSVSGTAMVVATFQGDVFGDMFVTTNNNKTVLDGPASGTAQLVYPLDHAVFPSNLSPIYAQIQAAGSIARLNIQGTGITVNFYGNCDTTLPGGGCYVKMPLSLTRLFIGPSESEDLKLTARVLSNGAAAPVETQAVNVAWANVALSGGLYYWSVVPNPAGHTSTTPTPPNYILLDTAQTSGTAIFRYAFASDGSDPVPKQVWTDDGGPSSMPPYDGAPQAFDKGTAGAHCIGCHAISNDGKYMALTIGGSSSTDGANFAMLDIGMQTLLDINPSASTDMNSSPTSNPTDYWKKFRMESVATENAWGPKSDRLVSMYQSKLYLTLVTATGATGTATRMGPVVPTWQAQEPYATDPFWSQDGTLFAFTSFAQASTGIYNATGLNGDMKKGGQIMIATADNMGVHDDAQVLIKRGNGVTSYYPSISNDSKLVVFNTSTCGGDPDTNKTANDYGNQSCDGYDDSSAKLWIVSPMAGQPSTLLARANGDGAVGSATFGNSWPRFSPDKGIFRGKELYWVAFSSRRPYGLQVNASAVGAKPQLWIAGVVRGEIIVGDPSFSPVWLPAQNPVQSAPNGNHVPQWVKVAVIIN